MGVVSPLYSQTDEGSAALNPALTHGHSLGVIRAKHVQSLYDITFLLIASRGTTIPSNVFNPNVSTGCSPILRALLVQSGIAHSVVDEISEDSQIFGHQGGNAIDVGPGDGGISDLRLAADVLRQFAAMFSCVVYQDELDNTRSLYIWDGVIVSGPLGLVGLGGEAFTFSSECQNKIHVASTKSRINHQLVSNTSIKGILTATGTSATLGDDGGVWVLQPEFSDSVFMSSQKTGTRW